MWNFKLHSWPSWRQYSTDYNHACGVWALRSTPPQVLKSSRNETWYPRTDLEQTEDMASCQLYWKPRFYRPRIMTQPSNNRWAPFAARVFRISDSSLQAPEPRFISATVFGFSHYKARLTRQQHDCLAQHWQNETWFPTSRLDIVILLPASKHKYNNCYLSWTT